MDSNLVTVVLMIIFAWSSVSFIITCMLDAYDNLSYFTNKSLIVDNGFVQEFYTGFIRFIDKSKTIRGKVVYSLIIYIVTIVLLPVIALSGIHYAITEFIKKNFDINE